MTTFLEALAGMSDAQRQDFIANYVNGNDQQKAAYVEAQTRAKIAADYGYVGAILDNPEVGQVLRTAAAQGWTKERLQGAIFNTNWWRNTSASQRAWEVLKSTDPA